MSDAVAHMKAMLGIHDKIAADVPQLARGRVWCRHCGATRTVDSAHCLRHGWPECCGETMTIDSPEERRQRATTPPAQQGEG